MTTEAERQRVASRSAVETLAVRSNKPFETIERLYLEELARLERDARIRTYLPLVALRRVRDMLRREYRVAKRGQLEMPRGRASRHR